MVALGFPDARLLDPRSSLSEPGREVGAALPLGARDENPRGIGFLELLREDLWTHEGDLLSQGFWALAVHRFGNWRMGVRSRALRAPLTLLYRFLEKWVEWLCGIKLSYTVKVGRRVHIWHFGGMVLGARSIGDDVQLRHNITMGVARGGDSPLAKPVIEDRVDIYAGAVIAGPIAVGHDSVIGANAVLLESVAPGSIVVGNPARVVRMRALDAERRAAGRPTLPPFAGEVAQPRCPRSTPTPLAGDRSPSA